MKTLIGYMIVGEGKHGTYEINSNPIFVPVGLEEGLKYYEVRGYSYIEVYANSEDLF